MLKQARGTVNAAAILWRLWRACALSLLLNTIAFTVFAADNPLTIQGANINVQNGVYLLDAELNFILPRSAEKSVRDGVVMNLAVEVSFDHVRRWWLNENIASLEQRYTLIYHSVSERFLLRNVNSGAQTSYASFDEALSALKNIRNLPLLDINLLKTSVRNEVSLRAVVEIRSIPHALGLLLFWVEDFSLKSDWYTWPMKPQNQDAP
jgi:hypothetical protein